MRCSSTGPISACHLLRRAVAVSFIRTSRHTWRKFAVSQMYQTSSFEGRPLLYSWICSHLSPWSRGSTAWVAKSAKICSYPGCFDTTRKGERPVEGPKNLHQPHGTAARSRTTTAQGNAHPPLLISGRPDEAFDFELLHSFVCALVSRLSVLSNDTVQLRIIITDRPARGDPLAELRSLGFTIRHLISDEYNIKVLVAKAGGFADECMKKIEKAFPANTFSRVEWREGTAEKLAFNK
jgi:hypothetical protein